MTKRIKRFLELHPPAAWMVLVLSLMVTAWAWHISDEAVKKSARERFEFSAEDVSSAISRRMKEYEFVLRSGRALFDSSNEVTRKDWSDFTNTIHLPKYYPGIQALGYSVMLNPEEVEEYVEKIRGEGFPDFQLSPLSPERSLYSAITYIEPFDWRNQRAFGYDMFSEATRRAAMVRARDTAQPSASGRVTLVQETDENIQYGFLMYYPVYTKNAPLETVQQRREALTSYVYAAFRMGDLMQGILGQSQSGLNFELYDATEVDSEAFLYSSAEENWSQLSHDEQANRLSSTIRLNIAGQPWTLFVFSKKDFIPLRELIQPELIMMAGIGLDIFLFYLISYLVRGRNQAKYSAEKAESDRELSQKRMKLAAEAAEMGLSVWNIPENKLYWDARMLTLYDYDATTFTGHPDDWQKRVHPNDLEKLKKVINHAIKFSSRFEVAFRIILTEGEIRFIEASIMVERNEAGKAVRLVGFNRDVTQQRQAEVSLNEKNWRLQNVLEGTNVGTWEWNIQTGETHFNERWANIIGYTLAELEPVSISTWQERIHPDDEKTNSRELKRHFDGDSELYASESRLRHRDGHWVWVLGRGKVFSWDDSGKPVLMFGTFQDITEQKDHELLLKQERDKAEQANRARGEFLANMSHEIRTPLNGVVGTLNLLSDTPLNTSQKNLVDVSKRSADTLLGLINDILDLSKIESGKLNIIREPVDLLAVVNEAAKAFASRAEAKQITLLCPDHYLPPYLVWSDGLRLRQVISNLLSNAVKFTQHGQITIDLQVQEQAEEQLYFQLNVRDSGPGISEQQQAQLFERFQQLDTSLTRKEGGTGLGLAICKQLVALMGGQIGVESDEGKGARFWFEMTLERHHDENLELYKPFASVELFIVAATPLYRRFYESVLSAWGVHYQHHPDLESASAAMHTTDSVHQLMVVDAEFLHEEAEHIASLQLKKPLLVTCPQSMLSDLPALLRDNADLIVSYPLVQSELYNAILSIVDAEAVQKMGSPVMDNSPTEFEARVLVVEDNPMNVTIVKGLLEKFGVSVSVAENGIEALSKLREESYDLVLMDCQMPEMDGYEATQQLRQDPTMPRNDIIVIALTAHAMREDEQKCLDAGMDDYLSKPVDPQLLNEKLSQWLPPGCLRKFAS